MEEGIGHRFGAFGWETAIGECTILYIFFLNGKK
jgi:hypothetical protein